MKLLKFYADWCGPCTRLTEWMKGIELPIEVENIDVDVEPDLKERYGITMLPTMVLLDDDGKVVKTVVSSEQIKRMLLKLEV